MATVMTTIRAIFFDVFGTLVDWRTGVAQEAERLLKPLGHKVDWTAFADAWRGEYQPGMEEVRAGRIPFCKLDVLHRRNLERFIPRLGLRNLSDQTLHELTLAWHRLDAWPRGACCTEAAQDKISARAGFERQYSIDGRSRPPQRISLGCDPRCRSCWRLQTKAARLSRCLRSL